MYQLLYPLTNAYWCYYISVLHVITTAIVLGIAHMVMLHELTILQPIVPSLSCSYTYPWRPGHTMEYCLLLGHIVVSSS